MNLGCCIKLQHWAFLSHSSYVFMVQPRPLCDHLHALGQQSWNTGRFGSMPLILVL